MRHQKFIKVTFALAAWSGFCVHLYFSNSSKNPDSASSSPSHIRRQLTAPLVEESMTEPLQYTLRDISKVRGVEQSAFDKQFADMSQCMDFKCNGDRSVCDNTLPTSYSNPDGPCCTHLLRDMLHIVDDAMVDFGLDYFVGFGTLLGLTRAGLVIPWTIDNDIVIDRKTLRVLTDLWNTEATGLAFVADSTGGRPCPRMCATSRFAGGKLQLFKIPTPQDATLTESGTLIQDVIFPNRGFPYIDWMFGQNILYNGHWLYGNEFHTAVSTCRHFTSDIFPTTRKWVYDGQFAINFPRKPGKLLSRYYGLDWKVPLTNNSPHGKYQNICVVNYGLEEVENELKEVETEGSDAEREIAIGSEISEGEMSAGEIAIG